MPRKRRFFVPGYAAHLVQRGNNRTAVFAEDTDCRVYLRKLFDAAADLDIQLHAYVLMTNHVHLLATPPQRDSLSLMMQRLGREYVSFFNRKYERTGTLWEGRFKACVVASERYALACHRYIEMNPVRANMVARPLDYPWSSNAHNVGARSDSRLIEHAAYRALGTTTKARCAAYAKLFVTQQGTEELTQVRKCLQSGTPFGGESFRTEIETELAVNVGQTRQGRPYIMLKGE